MRFLIRFATAAISACSHKTQAVQVRLWQARAIQGVEVSTGGRLVRIETPEIILAAGAFDSQKLLMLSGIGDPEELQHAGIAEWPTRCRVSAGTCMTIR